MKRELVTVLVTTLVTVSCGGEAGTDTGTGPSEPTLTTEHFSGMLGTGEVRFHSFRVNGNGPVSVTLASVTHPATGAALLTPLDVGLGLPLGTGCEVKRRVTAPPGLVAQINDSTIPGTYCVEVADPGTLVSPVNFAVRFTHP